MTALESSIKCNAKIKLNVTKHNYSSVAEIACFVVYRFRGSITLNQRVITFYSSPVFLREILDYKIE